MSSPSFSVKFGGQVQKNQRKICKKLMFACHAKLWELRCRKEVQFMHLTPRILQGQWAWIFLTCVKDFSKQEGFLVVYLIAFRYHIWQRLRNCQSNKDCYWRNFQYFRFSVLSTFLQKEIVPQLHFFILLDFAFSSLEAYLDSSNMCFHGKWKLGRDTWFCL